MLCTVARFGLLMFHFMVLFSGRVGLQCRGAAGSRLGWFMVRLDYNLSTNAVWGNGELRGLW